MFKVLLIAASSVIFLLLAGYALQIYLENKIHKRLGNDIIPGHTVRIDEVNVRILSRTISAKDIQIIPDKAAENGQQRFRIDSCIVENISLEGISAFRYLFSKNLEVRKLNLGKTDLLLSIKSKDTSAKKERRAKNILLKKTLLKKLKIADLRMLVSDMESGVEMFSVDKLKVQTNEIKASAEEGSLNIDGYPIIEELLMDSIQIRVSDGFYKLKIGQLTQTGKNDYEMQGAALEPLYPEHTFTEKRGYQSDRMTIAMERMSIQGLDLSQLHENVLVCQSITTNGIHSDFFRDKRFARPENHEPPLIQQALRNMKLKLCIDAIRMNNNEFRYAEYVPKAAEAGVVFFKDLNLKVENFNNDPVYFKRSEKIRTIATTKIMGQSHARVEIIIPVTDVANTLYFSGEIEPMELKAFNGMLINNQQMRINKGTLDKLIFNAQANNDAAKGKLEFLYHDLNMTVFKREGDEDKDRKLFSFLMNAFLRSDNPKRNKEPIIVDMDFKRDRQKGFVSYMWKTLLEGVKKTVTDPRSRWVTKKKP